MSYLQNHILNSFITTPYLFFLAWPPTICTLQAEVQKIVCINQVQDKSINKYWRTMESTIHHFLFIQGNVTYPERKNKVNFPIFLALGTNGRGKTSNDFSYKYSPKLAPTAILYWWNSNNPLIYMVKSAWRVRGKQYVFSVALVCYDGWK